MPFARVQARFRSLLEHPHLSHDIDSELVAVPRGVFTGCYASKSAPRQSVALATYIPGAEGAISVSNGEMAHLIEKGLEIQSFGGHRRRFACFPVGVNKRKTPASGDGSSLLFSLDTWVAPQKQLLDCDSLRFIPTPVGNTTGDGKYLRANAIHPHACGEHPSVRCRKALSRRVPLSARSGRHHGHSAHRFALQIVVSALT